MAIDLYCMSKTFDNKLLDFLVSANLINYEQLTEVNEALAAKGANLDQILIDKGILDWERLTEVKASLAGLSYVNLADMKIDEAALNILPPEVAENY